MLDPSFKIFSSSEPSPIPDTSSLLTWLFILSQTLMVTGSHEVVPDIEDSCEVWARLKW